MSGPTLQGGRVGHSLPANDFKAAIKGDRNTDGRLRENWLLNITGDPRLKQETYTVHTFYETCTLFIVYI